MSPEEYKERYEKELKKVRNIKDGLINKVVEDFTDYAIHTHYYFSNGVDLIVCRELYPFSFLFLRTNKTYTFCTEDELPKFIHKEISLQALKEYEAFIQSQGIL
tara:strand:+ start:153 stop:464 length:312 start_codon:yes stop_codon:yes gene_type:complete